MDGRNSVSMMSMRKLSMPSCFLYVRLLLTRRHRDSTLATTLKHSGCRRWLGSVELFFLHPRPWMVSLPQLGL